MRLYWESSLDFWDIKPTRSVHVFYKFVAKLSVKDPKAWISKLKKKYVVKHVPAFSELSTPRKGLRCIATADRKMHMLPNRWNHFDRSFEKESQL